MSEIKIPANSEVMIHQLRNLQLIKEEDQLSAFTLTQTPGVIQSLDCSNFLIEESTTVGYIDIGALKTNSSGGQAIAKDGHILAVEADQDYVCTANDVTDTYLEYSGSWSPVRTDDPVIPAGYATSDPYAVTYKRNSGNIKIPVTINSTNYFFIDYIQVLDDTTGTTVITEDTPPVTHFSKYKDGYRIYALTTATAPTATCIYLGSADVDLAGVISNISTTGREYFQSRGVTVQGTLGTNTDKTVTYTESTGQAYSLDEHFQSKGTGTVNANNPHGLSATDIGVFSSNTNLPTTYVSSLTYSVTSSNGTMIVDATSNNVTLTLPAAAAAIHGIHFYFKRKDSTGNTVTVDGNGYNIDGAGTKTLTALQAVHIICGYDTFSPDTYKWYILGTV
jgi:hypothetical protein